MALKISDLSVGDWVMVEWPDGERWRGKLTRLSEAGGIEVSCANGKHVRCSSNFISPIPITAKMLKKNGFEDGLPKGKAYKLGVNNDVWLFRSDKCWDFRIYHDFYSEGIIQTKLWIEYIHQLQHALRLAGVEKEINL